MKNQYMEIVLALENWKSFMDSDTNQQFKQIDDISMMALKLKKV